MNYQVHKTVKYMNDKGIDIISQNDDDPNHFDPRYFGKNRRYHQPEKYVIENTIKDLDFIANNITSNNFMIKNAGFDSKLQSFPKCDLYSLLNIPKEEQEKVFNTHLVNIACNNDESIIGRKDFIFIDDAGKLKNNLDSSFSCNVLDGCSLINKTIFTHIPIGPFEDQYYFINRKQGNIC